MNNILNKWKYLYLKIKLGIIGCFIDHQNGLLNLKNMLF